MSMSDGCALDFLAESMCIAIENMKSTIEQIGTTRSTNTLELETRNWVTALFCYNSLENSKLISRIRKLGTHQTAMTLIEKSSDREIKLVQGIMDMLKEHNKNGTLIQRTKNRFLLSITDLETEFIDHHSLVLEIKRSQNIVIPLSEITECEDANCEWIFAWLVETLGEEYQEYLVPYV